MPGGLPRDAPDDAGDSAYLNASAKTTTLNNVVTVGTVQLGFGAVGAALSIRSGTALTAIDEFSIGPGGELQFLGGTVIANSVVLTATSAAMPGDFNFDGNGDGRDFLAWQRKPSVGSLVGWQANYGMVAPLSASLITVPEPSTWMLLSLAAAGGNLAWRRRQGSTDAR